MFHTSVIRILQVTTKIYSVDLYSWMYYQPQHQMYGCLKKIKLEAVTQCYDKLENFRVVNDYRTTWIDIDEEVKFPLTRRWWKYKTISDQQMWETHTSSSAP